MALKDLQAANGDLAVGISDFTITKPTQSTLDFAVQSQDRFALSLLDWAPKAFFLVALSSHNDPSALCFFNSSNNIGPKHPEHDITNGNRESGNDQANVAPGLEEMRGSSPDAW